MIYLILIIAFLITIREGLQHRDRIIPSKTLSKCWHYVGGFMRISLFVLLYFVTHNWMILSACAIIMFPLYNIACSVGRKQKWWYVGNVALTDRMIRKLFFFINFDK
jgi:hypothetical protein